MKQSMYISVSWIRANGKSFKESDEFVRLKGAWRPFLFIYYLRIENAEGYVLIAVYLYTCVRAIRISKKVLNGIAWNFDYWIGYYPGTIRLDFGIDRVKGQGQDHEKVKLSLNRMQFSGMIGYHPGTIWLDFGIDRVKGQGQGHENVNLIFTIAR